MWKVEHTITRPVVKATEMTGKCEKCGGGQVTMVYDENHDQLQITCYFCSHTWEAAPIDQTPTPDRQGE